MMPYNVFPMFRLGPLHINMYGIMFALGVLAATFLALKEAEKRNIKKDGIYDLVFYLLIGVIIGARLFYVIFYWPKDTPLNFLDIFKIWEGGLSFFGGLIGALTAGYIYINKNKLNFWLYADIFAIPIVAGHIFGRLGDYFTGAHPGKITELPWAIYMDNALRHPVVLYEIIGLCIIVIILLNLKKIKSFEGFLFLSYIMLYSTQRMILDFFRDDMETRYLGLTPSQYIAVFLFMLTAYLLIKKRYTNTLK